MPGSSDEILERVRSVVADVLKVAPGRIRPSSTIREELGADSLDVVSLLMAFEEEFKSSISDEEAKELLTIQDVVTFVERKLSSVPAAS
jgi:acyl carrier protein